MMGRAGRIGRGGTLAGLGLLVACSGEPDSPTESSAAIEIHASPTPAPADVDVAARPPGHVGVVVARDAVELSAEVQGRLVASRLELGDRVEAHAPIASIEVPTLAADLDSARAELDEAIAEAREATLSARDAERRLAADQALVGQGASSREDRARSQLEFDKAEAGEARAIATIAGRRAALARLEATRASSRIAAPFSGRLAAWHREDGEVVEIGDPIARLVATDELWVRFAVPIEALSTLTIGARVDVELEPSGPTLSARVLHIAPELELASQMTFVEAELGPREFVVQPGQACSVRVSTASP
ncbi:efflux RND transporter periplasmic adaptor subunit [Nannocystaceae bacterium ST9]